MGRKPNQLILEFFERGPKLEDASNRYQHTCKSCGEKFPKGRIDSLTNHLVKKCPALPLRDRQRAVLQFHELPDLPEGMAQMASMHGQPLHGPHGPTMSLPFAPKQGMSALETLAEVSRQHLDLSGKRIIPKQKRKTPPPPVQQPQLQQRDQQQHQQQQQQLSGSVGSHGGLLDEFINHDDRPDGSEGMAVSHSMDMANPPALPSIYQFNGPLHTSPNSSPHLTNVSLPSSSSMASMVPSLVMAASAANELSNMMPLLEPELNMANTGISDKYFHSPGRPQWPNVAHSPIDPSLHDHAQEPAREHIFSKDDILGKTMAHHRPIAMNPNGPQTHFTTDFSMNQKVSKPKVRGRFSDTRRKEVQEVRKRGACIRCRMLKKPCSGESPCNTCVNVESARLWKAPCIRTRVAEEFNLYSAGLHGILAFQAISQAKQQIRLDQIPGRIEASHYPDSGIFAAFTPLRCQAQGLHGSDIDPAILASLAPSSIEIIDTDDDIGGKLDLYVKKIGNAFYDTEESAFMKATLRTALGISPSNTDGLLSKVIELWNLTRMLTSHTLEWHLVSNPSLAPSMTPSTMSKSDIENTSRTPITSTSNPSSYDLIRTQLMGATEKRAACLARVVMNDLERRHLQRQQANPFETFIIAVILLACVERMCWLFQTWEQPLLPTKSHPYAESATQPSDVEPAQPTSDDNLAQALQSDSSPPADEQARNPKWPFDRPPAYYSQQGERFSDVLYMLLKMRGVPPRPAPRIPDGVLGMWATEGGTYIDEKTKQWYEDIGITAQFLEERREARFHGKDPREWELKYVAKIVGGV